MAQRDFGSSRILSLFLLLGTALPVVAQKESPKPPSAAKEPQKLSDAEIAVLREKRENAVWLQKFIVGHESQMDIGSSLALTPNPCDDFEKDNPSLPDAKTFCIESRTLYTTIQKDWKIGTDNLPDGWKGELEATEKRIPDSGVTRKVSVHNNVDKPDPEFDQLIAANIGWVIDSSKGLFSQQDTVVLPINLIDAVQEPMQASLRTGLLDYMVKESHAPIGKTEAVRKAIKESVEKAASAETLLWLAVTTGMQRGSQDGAVFILTSDRWASLSQKYIVETRITAASVIRGENSRVIPPTPSPNAPGAVSTP